LFFNVIDFGIHIIEFLVFKSSIDPNPNPFNRENERQEKVNRENERQEKA